MMKLNFNTRSTSLHVEDQFTFMESYTKIGVGLPFGAHDQIFFCLIFAGFFMRGALSDERMDL
jgi:hypothetical protein